MKRSRKMSPRLKGLLLSNLRTDWRRKRFKGQDGLCAYCGQAMALIPSHPKQRNACTLDHRIPLSRAGVDHWENSVAACYRCNTSKGDLTAEEFMEKVKRPLGPEPAASPASPACRVDGFHIP